MQRRIEFNRLPLGWPERFLAGTMAVLLLLLGLAFGAVVLSLAALAGLGISARLWWLRRRLRRQTPPRNADVIEAEYRVVERHSGHPGHY
jgi:hypothetical protein